MARKKEHLWISANFSVRRSRPATRLSEEAGFIPPGRKSRSKTSQEKPLGKSAPRFSTSPYKMIFDSCPLGIVIVRELTILTCNAEFDKLC